MEVNTLAERIIRFGQRKIHKHSHQRVNCPIHYRHDIHSLPNGFRVSIGTTEHLYFDELHRGDILRNLLKVVDEHLATLDRIFWKYRRIEAFRRWKNDHNTLQKRLRRRADLGIDNSGINKRTKSLGATTILRIFISVLKEEIAESFYHWLNWIKYRRRIVGRFFDKWNVKTSLLALNRMNARRFLYLLQRVGKKYRYFMLLQGWRQLRDKIEHWRLMKRLKLWFRCWKTVVKAIIEGRKRRARRALRTWRDDSRRTNEHFLRLQGILQRRLDQVSQQKAFLHWYQKWRTIRALKTLFSIRYNSCFPAWNQWKYVVKMMRLPREVRMIESQPSPPRIKPPPPRPAPVASSSSFGPGFYYHSRRCLVCYVKSPGSSFTGIEWAQITTTSNSGSKGTTTTQSNLVDGQGDDYDPAVASTAKADTEDVDADAGGGGGDAMTAVVCKSCGNIRQIADKDNLNGPGLASSKAISSPARKSRPRYTPLPSPTLSSTVNAALSSRLRRSLDEDVEKQSDDDADTDNSVSGAGADADGGGRDSRESSPVSVSAVYDENNRIAEEALLALVIGPLSRSRSSTRVRTNGAKHQTSSELKQHGSLRNNNGGSGANGHTSALDKYKERSQPKQTRGDEINRIRTIAPTISTNKSTTTNTSAALMKALMANVPAPVTHSIPTKAIRRKGNDGNNNKRDDGIYSNAGELDATARYNYRSGGDSDVENYDDLSNSNDTSTNNRSSSGNNSTSASGSNSDGWQGIESGFYFEAEEKVSRGQRSRHTLSHRNQEEGGSRSAALKNVNAVTIKQQERLQTDMVSRIKSGMMARLTETGAATATGKVTIKGVVHDSVGEVARVPVQSNSKNPAASRRNGSSSTIYNGASRGTAATRGTKADAPRFSKDAKGKNPVRSDVVPATNDNTTQSQQKAPELLVYRQIPSGLSKRDFAMKVRKEKQFKRRLELVEELNDEFGYKKESTALLQSIQRG